MKIYRALITITLLSLYLISIGQSSDIGKKELFNKSVKRTMEAVLDQSFDNSPVFEIPQDNKSVTAHFQTLIGESTYDLQTNSILGERSYLSPTGEMAMVWTMSNGYSTEFSDRGTGYAYTSGGFWSNLPYQSIEDPVKIGWPSIDLYNDGEVITSHGLGGDYTRLGFMTRSTRGTGDWSTVLKPASVTGIEYVWNRLATSGPDNSIIHILSNSYNEYNGQEKALLYNRTTDGGNSWEAEDIVLEGIGPDCLNRVDADDYKIIAKENTVVVLLSSPWHDLFYLRSDDNGQTWGKNVVWEHPYPLFDFESTITTDTIWAPDGSLDATIDNDGEVHIVFGLTRVIHTEAGPSYNFFPHTDGIIYWNEGMTAFENPENQHYALKYDNLTPDQRIGWVPDMDGDGEITYYNSPVEYPSIGLSTMPTITHDDNDNIYVCWSAMNELRHTNFGTEEDANLRHIYGRAFSEGEWLDIIHLTDVYGEQLLEFIYPDLIGFHNDCVHLTYWDDQVPGLHQRDDHQITNNDLVYSRIEFEDFGIENTVDPHFVQVWEGNPYQPMTVIVNGATILGNDAQPGDEIGIFDVNDDGVEICVGFGTLENVLTESNTLAITTSTDDPDTPEQDGFIAGNDLIVKIYDTDKAKEYSIVTIEFNEYLDKVFTPLGTALISVAGYSHFVPNWTGNPYQPMTLLVNSATIEEMSFGDGDEIGVFDVDADGNMLCVGVGFLENEPTEADPLIIQLSKDDPVTPEKDGFTDGNEILYVIYDNAEGVDYDKIEAVYVQGFDEVFTSLGTGIVDLAVITSIDQELDLNTGWNIISFNNQPEDMNMLSILQPLVDDDVLVKVINESGGFIQNIPGVGWMNTIGDMANTEGYYVKSSEPFILNTVGAPLEYPYCIPLSTGWNIMGFPTTNAQNAMNVLQPIIDEGNLIKVISESGGFIQNIPGVGWMNTIGNFEPGHGYYVKVVAPTEVTITEEAGGTLAKKVTSEETEFVKAAWNGNPYKPMHVIFTNVEESGMIPGTEVGVFSNDICVGATVYNGTGLLPITVGMDENNEVMQNEFEVRYYDLISGELIDLEVSEGSEMKLEGLSTWTGKLGVINSSSGVVVFQNAPNPFNNQTEISFNLPEDGFVQLVIINATGQVVKTLEKGFFEKGEHRKVYTMSQLSSGVYNCQFMYSTKEKKQILNNKIVKQ